MLPIIVDYFSQRKRIKIIEQEITKDFNAIVRVNEMIIFENSYDSEWRILFKADFKSLCDWIVYKKEDKQVKELVQHYSLKMKNILTNYETTRSYESHKKSVLYGELYDDYDQLFKSLKEIVL